MEFKINNRLIGPNHPTYFIADIAANHDGSLDAPSCSFDLPKKPAPMQPSFNTFKRPKLFLNMASVT